MAQHRKNISFLLFLLLLSLPLFTNASLVSSAKNGNYASLNFQKKIGVDYANAIPVDQSKHSKPYVIKHVAKTTNKNTPTNSNDTDVSFEIVNLINFYAAEIGIGSPEIQNVTVLLDTGSSDLWVVGSDNPYCDANFDLDSSDIEEYDEEFVEYLDENDIGLDVDEKEVVITTEDFDNLVGKRFISDELEKKKFPKRDVYSGGDDDGDDIDSAISDAFNSYSDDIWNYYTSAIDGFYTQTYNDYTSTYDNTIATDCELYGTFDSNKSKTFKKNDTEFYIVYGDDSSALGNWATDKVYVDGLEVDGLTFAVANMSDSSTGVLGIGLMTDEATEFDASAVLHQSKNFTYPNLPVVLKQNGIINSTSYSLYLNDSDSSSGTVLFGAVDHSKYLGQLYTLPLINIYKKYGIKNVTEFDVTLQGLGFVDGDNNYTFTNTKIPALLDSGTTLLYLPDYLLEYIADSFSAYYTEDLGLYIIGCDKVSDDQYMVFDFGGFHINIPFVDFVLTTDDEDICVLGISGSGDLNNAILGDSFLRSTYVVYDLDNLEIAMAPANSSSSSSLSLSMVEGEDNVSNLDKDAEVQKKHTTASSNSSSSDNKSKDSSSGSSSSSSVNNITNTLSASYSYATGNNIEVIGTTIPRAIKAPGYSNTWTDFVTRFNTSGNIFTIFNATNNYFPTVSISTNSSSTYKSTGAFGSKTSRSYETGHKKYHSFATYIIKAATNNSSNSTTSTTSKNGAVNTHYGNASIFGLMSLLLGVVISLM
ncbi:uncharacterized protein SCDLUD_001758 [Saccharomycodes ludwigii]|uniref:uncharacterized protein n=1 Tax=Saccharomycodes ludwigii TaxID=36035 RepID=UPI001E87EAFE|nr:hypothetical protein SCDLUD_001758 [Saccharomycodes ludwigii]KAH3901971.1 hypothetical protein SCDLUD_001758 [Saccharomycodes ludwigii]